MQISEGRILYQNNITQTGQNVGAEGTATQNQVTQQPAAIKQELLQLVRGSIFEGVVTSVKDNYVQISLSNGQSVSARLENGVNIKLGEPVLFEVKSNQDGQIMLKQVPVASQYNPTLQKALTAAGLPLTERNLQMVNAMMQKQMPIDKNSLSTMARQVQNFQGASPETVVQMKKLGFVLNDSSVQQFTAYKEGQHSLVNRFSQIMDQLPEMLDTMENGGFRTAEDGTVIATGAGATGNSTMAGVATNSSTGQLLSLQNGILEVLEIGVQTAGNNEVQEQGNQIMQSGKQIPISDIFCQQQMESLKQQLKQIPGMEEDAALFSNGKLNGNLNAGELLATIQKNIEQAVKNPQQVMKNGEQPAENPEQVLKQTGESVKNPEQATDSMEQTGKSLEQWQKSADSVLKELFGGKEYKSLLKQVMEEQWMLKPEQVESKEEVQQLYERLDRQMEKLEHFLQNTGRENMVLDKNVSQARGNLEMMNQINQLYNYIQIPLKLQNQNAHSDLYVYTNKKRLMDKDGELSALLHLELDNLGTTDIQIKMLGTAVTTNFYLADDSSYQLVEQHIGTLQKHLEQKGYHCTVHLECREEKIDFVEDFLEHEAPIGKLQRYSFDVLT